MILGIDVWEGSLEINEFILLDSGVKFAIPRLNSISGGHHLDDNFYLQWQEAAGFLRAPYFVYSPWATGEQNAAWLMDNLPDNAPPRIFCDIEVRRDDYPADIYDAEVEEFLDILVFNDLRPCNYTGQWFLPYLESWPKGDYWWARYPYDLYPPTATAITWHDLKAKIEAVGWYPDPAGVCPGTVKLWQCSADRYIPTGTLRTMDINVWNGTLEELEDWWGAKFPLTYYEPPTTPVAERVRINTGALNIRSAPVVASNLLGLTYLGKEWVVMGRVMVDGKEWIQIAPEAYIAEWLTVKA